MIHWYKGRMIAEHSYGFVVYGAPDHCFSSLTQAKAFISQGGSK